MATVEVLHFTDPGCPWAYSARPAHARLRWRFGDQLAWRLVLIGLAESPQQYVDRGYTPEWAARGLQVFRERFAMPFAVDPKARMSATAPACRAVVAAREMDPRLGEAVLRALQLLHFTTGRLLDDHDAILESLSGVTGLDAEALVARLEDPEIVAAYEADRALARTARGSATEAQDRAATTDGPVRYTAPSLVFEHRDGTRLEAGGFQPFEAYDVVLANLDPTLDRRPPPTSARDALAEFPDGLTTAEIASVLRPSDLVDADVAAAEQQLLSAVANGEVVREPAGQDAIWRLTA